MFKPFLIAFNKCRYYNLKPQDRLSLIRAPAVRWILKRLKRSKWKDSICLRSLSLFSNTFKHSRQRKVKKVMFHSRSICGHTKRSQLIAKKKTAKTVPVISSCLKGDLGHSRWIYSIVVTFKALINPSNVIIQIPKLRVSWI